MKLNPLTCIDFYKADHRSQYPKGTELVYSNFTPRSDKLFNAIKGVWDNKVVFVGLQGFIKWFLIDLFNDEFFNKPKEEVVSKYKRRLDNSLGKDAVAVDHIEALHDLGYLPLMVKALPEGSRVGMKIPVFTVVNTKPEFFWLVNYLETVMSAEVWKTTTNATIAYEYRKLFEKYAQETGAPLDFVQFQGHDFSFRGMSGVHDAAQSGFGHLTSFTGTDTVPAIDYAEEYYKSNSDIELVGCSVPASEHSVMCMGTKESEIETFRRFIQDIYPSGVVSIVSDTWDYWKVISEYSVQLKDIILSRSPNALGLAKVVFRPDSGDPVDILCGIEVGIADDYDEAEEILMDETEWQTGEEYGPDQASKIFKIQDKYVKVTVTPEWNRHDKRYYYIDGWEKTKFKEVELTPKQKGSVECLWEIFGGTITEQGYKVLNERVGLIYGDSITLERANEILKRLKDKGFASNNVVFGIGSYTYQYNTRDTFGFAMKATYGVVNGEGREIFKDPVTDSGTKKSAKGLLRVELENGEYVLYDQQTSEQEKDGELKIVFLDGKAYDSHSLNEIRERLGWV